MHFGRKKKLLVGFLDNMRWSIGVDLGTANSWWVMKGKGVMWTEPTVVARKRKRKFYGLMAPVGSGGETVAFGTRAKLMMGKEPRQLEVLAPIKDGVIADFEAVKYYMHHFLELLKETPSRFPKILKPLVVAGVPSGITEVEKRAVRTAFLEAGAGRVYLIEEPLLTALGSGMPVDSPAGMLIVDIGGGTTEIALVSLGGVVLSSCLRVAGEEMDEAVLNFVKMKYGLLVGQPTAEALKIKLGSVRPKGGSEGVMVIRGRSLENGLPKSVRVSEEEVREALAPVMQKICKELHMLIEESPPELIADVVKRGIVVAGGGALLKGVAELFEEETHIPAWVVKDPMGAVARGIHKLLEEKEWLKKIVIESGD